VEKQVQILTEGDELQLNDVNRVGEAAGLADDRVFAELLRMKPYGSTQKAILPYAVSGGAAYTGLTSTALVQGNTADSRVRVMPFRAFVSSLDNATTTEEVRGIRSGLLAGSSTVYTIATIAANGAGDPRWTLVYAVVTPDASGVAENRYNKDPGTLVVTSNSRVTYLRTTVTVTTLNGATLLANATSTSFTVTGSSTVKDPASWKPSLEPVRPRPCARYRASSRPRPDA
jgi:hypothetical protein